MIVNAGSDPITTEVEAILNGVRSDVNNLFTDLNNEINTMMATLNTTISNSVGTVKSIQRGVALGTDNGNLTININPVNPDKCIVLINPSYIINTDSTKLAYLVSITETEVVFSYNGTANPRHFGWQVVEFY